MCLLRQIEVAVGNGKTTAEASKEALITEQTYYRWKSKFGGMELSDAKRLKQLEDENRRLKRLVAEQAVKKRLVPRVGRETIRILLLSHDLKPWREKNVVRSRPRRRVHRADGGASRSL